jgi:hypothetical protein
MRKSLALGMILRSDDTVGSAITLSTMIRMGQWAEKRGVSLDCIPVMGGGKDLARAEVLAAFRSKSTAGDLLFIDHGNGIPTEAGPLGTERYLDALVALEAPVVCGPYLTRGGDQPAWALSLPAYDEPSKFLSAEWVKMPSLGEELHAVRLLELGGTGMGWCRLRRHVVDALYETHRARMFLSDRTPFGELECVDVFSSRLGRRGEDKERPRERPIRLLPEDDSFCLYLRELGFAPRALVDMPIAHGKSIADFACHFGLAQDAEDTQPGATLGSKAA